MKSARRRAKVVPLSTPGAKAPKPRINHDLLDEARKDAFVLLLALDGLRNDAGTYTHEDQAGVLQSLAHGLSTKLATIGRQASEEA